MDDLNTLQELPGHVVTILGTAGIGKTSLARQLGLRLHRAQAVDVWFCDLSQAQNLEELCTTVLAVLSAPARPSGNTATLMTAVARQLTALGDAILILDNVEQIVGVAAKAVTEWREEAPGITFLVTSRERLRIPGEYVHPLRPLTVETERADGARDELESEASQLFLQRARMLRPNYTPDEAESRVIAQLMADLDGIPLAIELAAARISILNPAEIRERLSERFELLSRGARGASPRQATLRGAIEWSWKMLEPEEKLGLTQCVAFRGGFSLPAAEAVIKLQEASVLDTVQSLCDKSLLRSWQHDGETRFDLYESLRAFAAEKSEGERPDLLIRHARYYLAAAHVDERAMPVPGQSPAFVTREEQNLQVIIQRGINGELGEELLIEAIECLDPVMTTRGPFDSWVTRLGKALQVMKSPRCRARVLANRGKFNRLQGALRSAASDLQEAADLSESAGLASLRAECVAELGIALHELGRPEESIVHFRHARALHSALNNVRGEARALGSIAVFHHEHGDSEEAERSYCGAIGALKGIGDERSAAIFSINLGDLYKETGRSQKAEDRYRRALEWIKAIEDLRLEGVVLGNLGGLAQEKGDLNAALRLREEAVTTLEKIGDRRLSAIFKGYHGAAHHLAGDLDEAISDYSEAIRVLSDIGDRRFSGVFQAYLATALAMNDQIEAARFQLSRASETLSDLEEDQLITALELHRRAVELASARASEKPDHEGILSDLDGFIDESVGSGDEVAFARRLLQGMVGQPAVPGSQALEVSPDGRKFRLPNGKLVNMGRRRAHRLILLALLKAREAGTEALSAYDLMEVGWPGQDLHPEHGTNRVYVTVSELRALGLNDILQNRDDGYILDPSIDISRVDDPAESKYPGNPGHDNE